MLSLPQPVALPPMPISGKSDRHILARYLVAKSDFDRGADTLITEGVGYGVGQIASAGGLRVVPCRAMLSGQETSPVTQIMATGTINAQWCYIDIGISSDLMDFHTVGFTGLLSLLAGDVFGRPYVREGLVLQDLRLPRCIQSAFPGPRFGQEGVLEKCGVTRGGFLLGLLLKPDIGVSPEYYADLAEAAAQGGIDYVKEDELTLDSSLCRRLQRAEAISERLKACGRKVLYATNATAPAHRLLETCSKLADSGASVLLINGLQVGLDGVAQIAAAPDIHVPIHLHRAGYDVLTTGPKGVGVGCLTKMFRLCGADIVHVGSPLGGVFSASVVLENVRCLRQPLCNMKRSLPLLSRSSIDTLDMMLQSPLADAAILLFDAYIYESAIGVERSVRQLKEHLAGGTTTPIRADNGGKSS